MTIINFITSLINIGWGKAFFWGVLLFFDGLVYYLVSYAYQLFILICSLNFSTLYGIIAPFLDRLQAVIMVFVVFKLGVALIQYMLDPEKAAKEGSKIIVNIFITAALLISYNFVFNVFNELSVLIIGNPTEYRFTTLSQFVDMDESPDEGLIMRAIFGNTDLNNVDVGDYLAYSTLSIFIHDYGDASHSTKLQNAICNSDGECTFTDLYDLKDKVDKDVEYHAGVSLLVGIFLVYSLVKAAIEIGVRMFKLLILQLLAPVAIITIIQGGIKSNTFQTYIKKYFSVFIEAFTRMLTILLVTVFVSKFFISIGDFFADIPSSGWTKGILTALVVVAAYKFSSDIPKFIDETLGTKLAGGDSKGGFGKFIGGMLGAGVGFGVGAIAGAAGGGLGGMIAGAGKGLAGGASSGYKGNGVADWFKGQKGVATNAKSTGKNIAARGGLGNVMLGGLQSAAGVGSRQDRELARLDRQQSLLDAFDNAQKNAVKDFKMGTSLFDKNGNNIGNASDYYTAGYEDVKLTDDSDTYANQMLQYDKNYTAAQARYDALQNDDSEIQRAQAHFDSIDRSSFSNDNAGAEQYRRAIEAAQQNIDRAKANRENELEQARIKVQEERAAATKRAKDYHDAVKNNITDSSHAIYDDSRGGATGLSRETVDGLSRDVAAKKKSYESVGGNLSGDNNVKTEKQRLYREKSAITNRASYSRTHGQNPDK